MSDLDIDALGEELYSALRHQKVVEPLTARYPDLTIEQAYFISRAILERRLADGEVIVGKKIGVTSKAVQDLLDVHQPDFGYLTDRMMYSSGDEVPIGTELISPRSEGEIAFVLKHALRGPGVTNADVLHATDYVLPCFEIVDSRIKDWNIRIEDTVADNASCGLVVLGDRIADPRSVDLRCCGILIEKNGQLISTGAGAAALGSPLNAVAWLANTLGAFGIGLEAGEIVLSGSLVPLEEVVPGDQLSLEIGGIGRADMRLV